MRLDGDRRGYVIADRGDERRGARARGGGGKAAGVEVAVSCAFDLEHYRELLEAARGRRLPLRVLRGEPRGGRPAPSPRRRPLARRGAQPGGARGGRGRARDVLPDDRSVFYNLASDEGEQALRAAARARPPRRPARRLPARRARRALRPGRRLAQPRSPVHGAPRGRRRQRDGAAAGSTARPTARTRTSTGARAVRTRSSRRRVRVAAAADAPRDLGLPGRDDAARRCSRCSTRSASAGSSSWPQTGSTSREAELSRCS